ncbi:histidine phosphatase family protein [Roseomonas sp. OT10]|uniref:histidine phosphatase family protein n=1 Tax=Roseomonas cutis TaxID=2897332 RepID=UPI001E60E586|nr:histidine phosphatase family protein [Roseomonas sp. OT10]UFN46989.1 histidine phosphatase family protein [Roseomonas sp. OT10]
MRLLLVRHLPAEIAPGLCYGRLDLPPGPVEAAEALAGCLAAAWNGGPARVWTSPARRCATLAGTVAQRLRAVPEPDPRLLELDFGRWEGLSWDAIPRDGLDAWAADPAGFAPPGGESGAALLARVAAFVADRRREGASGVVVTHGGPLRLLPALLRGTAPDLLAPAPPPGAWQVVEAAG